jgi:hypothetical protein
MNGINRVGRRMPTARAALATVAVAFSLTGCGLAARVDARNDYQSFGDQLQSLLSSQPGLPSEL